MNYTLAVAVWSTGGPTHLQRAVGYSEPGGGPL